jgi:hypothetical protein
MARQQSKILSVAEKKTAEANLKTVLKATIDGTKASETELAAANKTLAQAKKQAEQRKSDRDRKLKLKSRGEWMKEAQTWFNKFIRLRDKGLPCVSCGHPDDGSRQRHASHYKSVGGNPSLRFDQSNCHSSCSICNNYLSGNLVPYRVALIQKIGLAEVERLEGPQEPLKLTIPEIQALIAEYKFKVKQLEKPTL